jgi:hypothetical protein
MDIHAPEGPVHSLKDFSLHILIVTIGILIALALEGLRETVREHHQLRETRELVHYELQANLAKIAQQRRAFTTSRAEIDLLTQDLPQQARDPQKLAAAVEALDPGFYFFTSASWQTALSTGVLDHMTTTEVNRFVGFNLSVQNYNTIQNAAVERWFDAFAYFHGRNTISPQDVELGREKLVLLSIQEKALEHLLDEMEDDDRKALQSF